MIYDFESENPVLILQIDAVEGDEKKKLPVCVEFVNHSFITEKDDVAEKIKATNMYKSGKIWLNDSSLIAGANKRGRGRPRTVSGPRGTVDEGSTLRKELAQAQAEIARLKKAAIEA